MDHHLYQFLGCCARAECHESHYEQLRQGAAKVSDWDEVAAEAERHGMAPLLYFHLKTADVPIPLCARRQLQGLTVRHRAANLVRLRVLHDILEAYQSAGIPALVLKGAVLSQLVYPEPGLRPMSDLDLLVPRSQVWRARRVLAELGFDAPLPQGRTLSHRHLPAATLRREGILVEVEIHHRLFSDYLDNALAYARSMLAPVLSLIGKAEDAERGLAPSDQAGDRVAAVDAAWLALDRCPFVLDGLTAYTLGYEDMLAHVCQHLISHVNVWDYARLIWVADMVALAEGFAPHIDWTRVQRQNPAVLETLSLLHFVTPLSHRLLTTAPIPVGRVPRGIGMEYRGWPQAGGVRWRERGYRQVLRDTFVPPEWWLRLRYRRGSTRRLFWQRWFRHPLYILGHVLRATLERMGWPTPHELAQARRAG